MVTFHELRRRLQVIVGIREVGVSQVRTQCEHVACDLILSTLVASAADKRQRPVLRWGRGQDDMAPGAIFPGIVIINASHDQAVHLPHLEGSQSLIGSSQRFNILNGILMVDNLQVFTQALAANGQAAHRGSRVRVAGSD